MRLKKEHPNPTQKAIDEQIRCAFPDPETDKFGKSVKGLWKNNRRRIDTIIIEATDKNKKREAQNGQKKTKRSRRKRKRGPRVLVAKF